MNTDIPMTAPYDTVAILDRLEKVSDPSELQHLRQLLSVNIGDRETLLRLLGATAVDTGDFYPDQQCVTPDTVSTIDSFLDKFGAQVPSGSRADELPLVPAADYLTLLAHEEKKSATEEKPESPATEEFANLLIKNGNYRRAAEIIAQLSLKNPEKSIYFADQMRFLRKILYIQGLH